MHFETKDSLSPEQQCLTSLNRNDLERKREIVIQKRKELEKKLLTTIDDLLAQKLGKENSTSPEKKKEQSIYEKSIQMKKNEIELKKKKLASYQEKRNKENRDILNGSTINNDNYRQALLSLKQKYPRNEKNASSQTPVQDLRQKYAYLLEENHKNKENQEERKSDLFSNYKENQEEKKSDLFSNDKEKIVQKTAQTVINLQQFKKDLIPKKVRLSNGRLVNENLAKTIALLEGCNFEIDSDRAKNESKIQNEENRINVSENTENIPKATILKKPEPKEKIEIPGKTILLPTGKRVNENIAKTIALLENSLGQSESNENSKNPQIQEALKQENDKQPEKIENNKKENKALMEENKNNNKIEQNPVNIKESHFSKTIKTPSGKIIHVSLAKRVALLEMAMKSGNADPNIENFSPDKINENTLKNENNPKILISPIKIENEIKNNLSPINSVNSTPVGTPKSVYIGKSGKPIAKTIFKRVMMLEKLFGSDGGSIETPKKNSNIELQHTNLERPSIPPIRKKTPKKDDNIFI